MSNLPVISGRQCMGALQKAGFNPAKQRSGTSHRKLRHASGRCVMVPNHDELDRGTLRGIIRQSGLSVDEFIALLNSK